MHGFRATSFPVASETARAAQTSALRLEESLRLCVDGSGVGATDSSALTRKVQLFLAMSVWMNRKGKRQPLSTVSLSVLICKIHNLTRLSIAAIPYKIIHLEGKLTICDNSNSNKKHYCSKYRDCAVRTKVGRKNQKHRNNICNKAYNN